MGNTAMQTAVSGRLERYTTSLQYADSGLALAQKISFRRGEAESYRTVGAMYYFLNDLGKSVAYYEKSLEICEEINDHYGKAALMYNLALIYMQQEKYVQTLRYYLGVIPYWERMGLKYQLRLTDQEIAAVYNRVGEYGLSIEFAKKAMSIANELNDTSTVALLYEIIAQNYSLKGDTLSAIDAYEKSIGLARLIHNIRIEARVLYDYASTVKSLPMDKRRQLLSSSRSYYEQYDPEHSDLAYIYQEISAICELIGKHDSAWYYMDKAIKQALLSKNKPTLSEIHYDAAQLSLENKKIEQAETYFQAALQFNEQVESAIVEQNIYNGLAELYSRKGDIRKAYEIKRKAIQIRDSIAADENRNRMELLRMRYEIEEQQKFQEAIWKEQAEKQQHTLELHRLETLLIIAAIGFLSVFLVIIFRSRRRTRYTNRKLQEQQEEILQIQKELRLSNEELNKYKEYLEYTVRLKTVEQAEKDQQIRNISDNLPGFIFRKKTKPDGHTFVSYVSNRVEQLIGIPANEVIAKKENLILLMVNEATANELKEKEKESIRTMTPFAFEYHLVKNHPPVWLLYYSLPHMEENGDIVWDGFVIDITELKEVQISLEKAKEQAEESERLKSDFLSNMSHEVRTPMNAILGFIEFIERENLPVERRNKFICIVQDNIDQLMSLIKNIIDISKLEIGRLAIYPTQFGLNALMEDIWNYWEKYINRRKPLNIILDDSRFIYPDTMFNDSDRIRQVFGNLIENATKFTDKGFIRFGYEPSDNFSDLLFFVEDTGVGIPKEQHNVIFEYFRQGNDTNLNTYRSGTGLGLSITKGLVEQMGGRIWIESVEEQGSTFYFTIKREIHPS